MSAPNAHDGVFTAANRTNEASGRSWHIPAETEEFSLIWPIIAVLFVAVIVAGVMAG